MEKTYYLKLEKRPKRNFLTILMFLAVSIITILLFLNFSKKSNSLNSTQSKISSSKTSPLPSPSPTETTIETNGLGKAVQDALLGTNGSYGIVIKNLKTGEQYALQENTRYETASLYKLWIMATVYEQMKNGTLNDNDILSQDVEVLNRKFEIATESAGLKEGKITLSVHDALEKMINISDNYAALLLTEKVRLSSVSLFLNNNGFAQSFIGTNGKLPITTSYDIALFFEKLYNGQLIDADYSNKMISLLKEQKLNDKIPKYLPGAIIVAHKTGELDEYTHDAGIVYANSYDYIIVVLSKSDDTESAAIRIANISKSVYDYFETK